MFQITKMWQYIKKVVILKPMKQEKAWLKLQIQTQ